MASRDSAKTAARQYDNLLCLGIWCALYEGLDGIVNTYLYVYVSSYSNSVEITCSAPILCNMIVVPGAFFNQFTCSLRHANQNRANYLSTYYQINLLLSKSNARNEGRTFFSGVNVKKGSVHSGSMNLFVCNRSVARRGYILLLLVSYIERVHFASLHEVIYSKRAVR